MNESQRAMEAEHMATTQHISRRQAALFHNVGRGSVELAHVVRSRGIPELVSAVVDGHVTVTAAAKATRHRADRQRAAVNAALTAPDPGAARLAFRAALVASHRATPPRPVATPPRPAAAPPRRVSLFTPPPVAPPATVTPPPATAPEDEEEADTVSTDPVPPEAFVRECMQRMMPGGADTLEHVLVWRRLYEEGGRVTERRFLAAIHIPGERDKSHNIAQLARAYYRGVVESYRMSQTVPTDPPLAWLELPQRERVQRVTDAESRRLEREMESRVRLAAVEFVERTSIPLLRNRIEEAQRAVDYIRGRLDTRSAIMPNAVFRTLAAELHPDSRPGQEVTEPRRAALAWLRDNEEWLRGTPLPQEAALTGLPGTLEELAAYARERPPAARR